jgi:hypothetical protein
MSGSTGRNHESRCTLILRALARAGEAYTRNQKGHSIIAEIAQRVAQLEVLKHAI